MIDQTICKLVIGIKEIRLYSLLLNWFLIVNELAFLAILTLARSCFMPFFTHFGFVIFVNILLVIELVISVSVCAVVVEFTFVIVHPVFAKFCFVVKSKVFDILYHLFPRFEIHLFLWSSISHLSEILICVLLKLYFLNLLHQLEIRLLIWNKWLENISSWIHCNLVQLSNTW